MLSGGSDAGAGSLAAGVEGGEDGGAGGALGAGLLAGGLDGVGVDAGATAGLDVASAAGAVAVPPGDDDAGLESGGPTCDGPLVGWELGGDGALGGVACAV